MTKLKLLDTVANVKPISASRLSLLEPPFKDLPSLPSGQIGTVVEIYNRDEPYYLVEFADSQGCEYAMATLKADELLAIRDELSVPA